MVLLSTIVEYRVYTGFTVCWVGYRVYNGLTVCWVG